jgi:hypothetical protein
MAVAIGVALAVNALLIALALSIGRQLFVDLLAGSGFAGVSKVFFNTLLAYLGVDCECCSASGWS